MVADRVVAVILGLLVVTVAVAVLLVVSAAADPGPARERIEEDDPRWDCRTMGNRECGPS